MTISFNWLKDFISVAESPEEIAALLTGTGLEVEKIEKFESIKGGLEGVVIGTVLTCDRHPNADKLSCTTVSIGTGTSLNIVCGAPNVAAGQRVVVALAGTTIYTFTGEEITLKSTKIRGALSEGMLCAADEIGTGSSHDGILVLDTPLPDGSPAAAYFKPYSDYIFEIGLTPNRADAASHYGVARDLRAVLNRPLNFVAKADFNKAEKLPPFNVQVRNKEACIRYSGICLHNIKIGPSPDWLQNRLKAIGLNPINNIVDITNYICHHLGQPLHAFDLSAIRGNQIIIDNLPAGTLFRTLDGKDRKLSENDLMICDGQGGMCIAGVFGGLNSGVGTTTTDIFLESACFSPDSVRKTSQHHQLVTDASFRFARGTDPNITLIALSYASRMIEEICGATVSSGLTDIYPVPVPNREFRIKDKKINDLIGIELSRAIILPILRNLDIQVIRETESEIYVSVPPYRVDVTQEADIAEEILRIYGFNRIPLTDGVGSGYLADFPEKDPDQIRRILGEVLTGAGYYEILTNSLSGEHYNAANNFVLEAGDQIRILNKLSEEQGAMRQTLLFSGLEVVAHNLNRKATDLRLFEFGKIFWKQSGHGAEQYGEGERLGLFITGFSSPESWMDKPREASYHDLAQTVQNILQRCNATKFKTETSAVSWLQYGIDLWRGKEKAGLLGLVNDSVLKNFGIKQPVFFAEIDTKMLFQAINSKVEIRELSRFPKVRRDLSLVLNKEIRFSDIQTLIFQTEKKLIKETGVFDVYEGKNIPQGKKAYAISFTLQDEQKTLTDHEIDQVMERLINSFEQKLGAVIRK
jgi:phenylalanyl-tRNA synthetase beta chain